MEKKLTILGIIVLLVFMVFVSGCITFNNKNIGNPPEDLSQGEINYFTSIALPDSHDLIKWDDNIRVKISGSPTAEDLKMVNYTISAISGNIDGLKMTFDDKDPNLIIYFIPRSEFNKYIPESKYPSVKGGGYELGGITDYYSINGKIINGTILIDNKISPEQRDRSIEHELFHSLGFYDTYNNPESIMYGLIGLQPSTVIRDIDKKMIRTLYRKDLKPGMTKEEVLKILNQNLQS